MCALNGFKNHKANIKMKTQPVYFYMTKASFDAIWIIVLAVSHNKIYFCKEWQNKTDSSRLQSWAELMNYQERTLENRKYLTWTSPSYLSV